MADSQVIHKAILQRLSEVIDPETGMDVIRMRLIEELIVDDMGCVSYTFHPSSPICPLAVHLVKTIWNAINSVQGVVNQKIKVTGFILADQLTKLLNDMTNEQRNSIGSREGKMEP